MVGIEIPKKKIIDFCHCYQVRELALFGSVLRNDFRPDSDIDVLIEFEPDAQVTLLTLSGMQIELSNVYSTAVTDVPVLRHRIALILKQEFGKHL